MIVVYTGDGKGKTSACIGQALRALGHNLTVTFAQFIKQDGVAGEQTILKQLLGDNFRAGGLGFIGAAPGQKRLHIQKARELLQWAIAANSDMLVLDEAIYACNYGLLDWQELDIFANRAGSRSLHLVLSGRKPEMLAQNNTILSKADIITVLQPRRHCYALGVPACEGIEY